MRQLSCHIGYFANYYLDGLDRLLTDMEKVRAVVRYMDDIIWWGESKKDVQETLQIIKAWLADYRALRIKQSVQIQPSRRGVTYCGFVIRQGGLHLTRRKKRRFLSRRKYWERQYLEGFMDSRQLQSACTAVQAVTAGTDSLNWRKENLRRYPPIIL